MHKILVFIFFIITMHTKGQDIFDIDLPVGGYRIENLHIKDSVDLIVTANREIYLNNERIRHFEDINYFILKNMIYKAQQFNTKFKIHADKNLPYRYIDKIRNYIPGIRVYFATASKDNSTSISIIEPNYRAKITELTVARSIEEQREYDSLWPKLPPLPFPEGLKWIHSVIDNLHTEKIDDLKSDLEAYKYRILKVRKDAQITIRDTILDNKVLTQIIKDNDLLFLAFDENITYQDFITANIRLQNLRQPFDSYNRAFVVEVRYGLMPILTQLN